MPLEELVALALEAPVGLLADRCQSPQLSLAGRPRARLALTYQANCEQHVTVTRCMPMFCTDVLPVSEIRDTVMYMEGLS